MPNILTITAENPDGLLNEGAYGAGAVVRLQSCATYGGTYADVSGTGGTPTLALVTGTRIYTGFDPAGTATSWYRTRYESATAARTSDWSDPFQAGGEEAGLICSLWDVKQRLGIADSDTESDEEIIEYIRAVTVDIETATGRDFTGGTSDTTVLADTEYGSVLYLPKGIQSVTTLKVATTDQPDTGGTYETLASGTFVLRPAAASRSPGWPATSIKRIDGGVFYDATNGAEITGRMGWDEVPANIARVGAGAVVRAWRARSSGGADYAIVGPEGGTRLLRYLSPEDRDLLELYTDALVP